MMKSKALLILTALAAVTSVTGYNVLCVFPVPSKSHSYLAKGIVEALLAEGHQVTWITSYPNKLTNKNLRQIEVSDVRAAIEAVDSSTNYQMTMDIVRQFGRNISTGAINSAAVREVLLKEKYDAVVSEWFFSDIDAGYAAVQQVPWIVLSGTVMHPYIEHLVDTVRSLTTIPDLMNNYPIPMNFWQRLVNTYTYGVMMYDNWREFPIEESLYQKYFLPIANGRGVPLPPLSEAKHNISIVFVNSHPSFSPAQSLPPNVLEIGGYHIAEKTSPLPKDLQEILDSSKNGVVYFSMGSVYRSKDLPEKVKRDLVKVLGDIPYTVLWKFEDEMDGLPKNVHIRSWMPQSSILAHPNVKVFITHGGLLSTLESLRFGVPIIAVPIFGDQPGNADRSVRAGHALRVSFIPHRIAPELKVALNEMLSNDSYYKKAKLMSELFNSRPVQPKKLVSHYIELAIQSKGAYHLRSKTYLYKWYEVWMLDQLALFLAILLIICLALKTIVCAFTRKSVKEKENKTKREKKNK